MEIKFYWNGSFVGHTYHMEIDGKDISLGLGFFAGEDEAIEKIIQILKDNYGLDYKKEDIIFEWGGCL